MNGLTRTFSISSERSVSFESADVTGNRVSVHLKKVLGRGNNKTAIQLFDFVEKSPHKRIVSNPFPSIRSRVCEAENLNAETRRIAEKENLYRIRRSA